ncbi:MAG TPA: hypothetical protein VKJ07_01780 [Mycobacteriales bacterium]|nr:hypothetical protein [Mycobacteriales bacterium]
MRALGIVVCALVSAGGAAAATFTFTPSATPVTVATVTLSGVDQTKTFTIANTVAYTGGSNNAGWKVQAAATTPTSGSNTLPALTVTAGSSACQSSCTTNPTNSIGYPLTLSGTAQTIYNAALNTGKGTFTVTSTFQVSYASNIFPGTYTSTVTLTGSTGP